MIDSSSLFLVALVAVVAVTSTATTKTTAKSFFFAVAAQAVVAETRTVSAADVAETVVELVESSSSETETVEGSCRNNDTTATPSTTSNSNDGNLSVLDTYKDRWVGCTDYERVWRQYEHIEEYQTLQQSVDIYYDEEDDDACLFLHGYLHMCASNRPHYHEPFVHYPARFLDSVERVLFIGGGDSMVLHEVLKYPTLELVVGLELDQSVVRSSFQYFGTQPHWDDERVEWYFGDGAKSLNLLPREYFGTFDLVVVDILSAIAQFLQVNDELTIMEALMLLLKPDGIIVKNEDEGYIPGASTANFTKHSVEIMFHDVPIYCLQTFVVGSNAKNFLDATAKDHGIETKYLKNIDEFKSQFDSYYNSNEKNLIDVMCERFQEVQKQEDEEEGEHHPQERQAEQQPEQQAEESKEEEPNQGNGEENSNVTTEENSTKRLDWDYMKLVKWKAPIGINLILETEPTRSDDSSGQSKFITASDIVSTFSPILTDDLGLVIIDKNKLHLTRESFSAIVVTFVFDQGYVVVRSVPELLYCGFDIQLWADFHKLKQIKKALLTGVETSDVTSRFHVVTSGMIDAKNEQPDLTGPPSVRDYCDSRSASKTVVEEEVNTQTTSTPQNGPSLTVKLAQTPISERDFQNTTLHSYDSTSVSARKQWESQRSIGVQTIQQFEELRGQNVNLGSLLRILQKSIEINFANEQDDDDDDVDTAVEIQQVVGFSGSGSVVIVSWCKGQAIVLWDGDGRVDVNWFLFGVDLDIPEDLMASFDNAISILLSFTAIVRDEIPRGIGRIINMPGEFEEREEESPLWF